MFHVLVKRERITSRVGRSVNPLFIFKDLMTACLRDEFEHYKLTNDVESFMYSWGLGECYVLCRKVDL